MIHAVAGSISASPSFVRILPCVLPERLCASAVTMILDARFGIAPRMTVSRAAIRQFAAQTRNSPSVVVMRGDV
jgi:hypothetical protein